MLNFLEVVEVDELSNAKIVRDRRTGVTYFYSWGYNGVSILSPLFGSDGNLLITDADGKIHNKQLFSKRTFEESETIVNTSGKVVEAVIRTR